MHGGTQREGVTRPSIPLVGWFAAAMWVGVCLAESVVWNRPQVASSLLAACVLGVLAVFAAWVRSRGGPVGALLPVFAGALVGVTIGTLFWLSLATTSERLALAGAGPFVCEVATDPVKGPYGFSVSAHVAEGPCAGALVSVMLPQERPPPGLGRRIEVRGRSGGDAGRDEWARLRHRQGQAGRIKAWGVSTLGDASNLRGAVAPFRRRLLGAVECCPGDGGALLQGVLLGERSRIRGTVLEEDFRTTGLSHLLAVSGTHISIVLLLAGGCLAALGVPLRRRLVLMSAFAGIYVLLTGAPISSLRAFAMALAAGLASCGGRRSDSLGGLSAAIVLLLAVSPANAFDIGFALSVCAVGGLVLFAPLAEEWARAAATKRTRTVASALSLPVVAQIATMPVAIPAFHMVSAVGPVANALVLPAASLGLGVAVVGALATAVWPWGGLVVLRAAAAIFAGTVALAAWLASLPHAAIPVGGDALWWGAGCFAACAFLWACWPHPPRRAVARSAIAVLVALFGVFVVGFQATGGVRLTVLDVGQGDAVLVADGGSAVLVDTGPNASVLREAVARVGLRRLDAVLLTHAHADHDGGLEGLSGVVDVGRVIVPASTVDDFAKLPARSRDLTGRDPAVVRQGDRLKVGRWVLDVLWPPESVSDLNTNDRSLVIEASYDAFRAVLTGDAEVAPQRGMERAGMLRRCDVLKVPHHGSAEGIGDQALALWTPRLALVSVGEGNDYGHPAASTMQLLVSHGVQVERTDHSGDLTVRISGGSFSLETARAGREREIASCRSRIGRMPYETMTGASVWRASVQHVDGMNSRGRNRHLRSQARLPHLRVRGPPARTGGGAPEEAAFRGCRSRIQPAGVRWRNRDRR